LIRLKWEFFKQLNTKMNRHVERGQPLGFPYVFARCSSYLDLDSELRI
jgi:hypothetical protein